MKKFISVRLDLFVCGLSFVFACVCFNAFGQQTNYYDSSGRALGSSRYTQNLNRMSVYSPEGRYMGNAQRRGNNIDYFDESGRRSGYSRVDSQTGRTTYYDSNGRYNGYSSKSGNTTIVYDSSGRLVQRQQSSTRNGTRVYDSSGRPLGSSDKRSGMSSNYISNRSLSGSSSCKK